jgi:hypothetical protein
MEIAKRIYTPETKTFSEYLHEAENTHQRLEYDGEFFWRVSLSRMPAPDGLKRIAFVVGGIRKSAISFPRGPHNAAKIVNAIINKQYQEWVLDPHQRVNARQPTSQPR